LNIFQIIKERLPKFQSRDGIIWNTSPGALVSQNSHTEYLNFNLPFNYHLLGKQPSPNFTVVIFSQHNSLNSPLYRLVRNIAASKYLTQVTIWRYITLTELNNLIFVLDNNKFVC